MAEILIFVSRHSSLELLPSLILNLLGLRLLSVQLSSFQAAVTMEIRETWK